MAKYPNCVPMKKYPLPSADSRGMRCSRCGRTSFVPLNFDDDRCGHCRPPTKEELSRWKRELKKKKGKDATQPN